MRILLMLLMFPILSSGQSLKIEGLVKSLNGDALSFSTVGIRNKGIGTIADINGYFKLEIADSLKSDSLTFSFVGFEELRISIQDLKPNEVVELKETAFALETVHIRGERVKQVNLGYSKNSKGFLWLEGKGNGAEVATRIPLSRKIFLDEVGIEIQNEKGHEFNLILNIYSVDKKTQLPDKQLLSERHMITSNQKSGWMNVDISDQNLVLDDTFYVSFKWIDIENETPLIGVNFKQERSYLRLIALGKWIPYLNANIKATGSLIK